MTTFAPFDPAAAPAPIPRDVLRESLQRRVAAKIVDLLPPDDESAHRIIDLVRQLYDEFVSVAACQANREAAR